MAEQSEEAWEPGKYRRKFAVSAAGGGLSFLITLALHMPDADKAFVIAIAGALIFSVQELYDVLQATAALLKRIVMIDKKLAGLPAEVTQRAAEFALTMQLGPSRPDIPPLITDLMTDRTAGFSDAMNQLRKRAPYRYAGEDREMLLSLAKVAKRTVDAISMQRVDSVHFWNSELGNQYLARQKAAIEQRGVVVRRIFIFTDLAVDRIEPAMEPIIARQVAAGVKVKVLLPSTLRSLVNIPLVDFIVFDGTLAYETSAGQTTQEIQPLIEHVELDWQADTVSTLSERYELLWNEAEEFSPTIPQQATAQDVDPDADGSADQSDPGQDTTVQPGRRTHPGSGAP